MDLVDLTFQIMREKNCTYAEARRELGRRGAAVRKSKNRRVGARRRLEQRKNIA